MDAIPRKKKHTQIIKSNLKEKRTKKRKKKKDYTIYIFNVRSI